MPIPLVRLTWCTQQTRSRTFCRRKKKEGSGQHCRSIKRYSTQTVGLGNTLDPHQLSQGIKQDCVLCVETTKRWWVKWRRYQTRSTGGENKAESDQHCAAFRQDHCYDFKKLCRSFQQSFVRFFLFWAKRVLVVTLVYLMVWGRSK